VCLDVACQTCTLGVVRLLVAGWMCHAHGWASELIALTGAKVELDMRVSSLSTGVVRVMKRSRS
jgi:hypothetical protein